MQPGPSLRALLADDPGYVVIPGAIDDCRRDAALRRLNLEILRVGITPEQIGEWKYATFWPSLRWEPEILALRDPVAELLQPAEDEVWADAQLLLRFPDEADEWPLSPHVDDLPDWAGEREYEAIVGVALTPSGRADGCLAVWPGSHRGVGDGPELVELGAGDVVVLHPRLCHSSTLNRGGAIRYLVYFRLLGGP